MNAPARMDVVFADSAETTDDFKEDDTYDATMTFHGLPDSLSPRVQFMRSQSLPSDRRLNRPRRKRTDFSLQDSHNEANEERGNWDNPIEFFLSCLGYAVGLGNIWRCVIETAFISARFPYLCYRNGGGAFLIPYLLMLFCCGLPLMLMELALGQFSSEGPLTVWKLSPLFKGLGIAMICTSTILATYYNLITGWGLSVFALRDPHITVSLFGYYLFVSIRERLPWTCCDQAWADERCVSSAVSCPPANHSLPLAVTVQSSADQFFHKVVLGITAGFGDFGSLQPHLTLALFFAWLIVFLVLMKGIKSIGKTVYFTTTFPYLVLALLFGRAVIEPGAIDGIKYYLRPDLSALFRAQVWGDAAAQIFYSTGVCQGGAICLASYNRFSNNLYRDAMVVTFGNSLTSIFSGFVVFSILGFMAHSQGSSIDQTTQFFQVVTSGPGLTFIAYPQAVTTIPWAPFWSALFFLMLVTLALSTMFPTVENIATALVDQFPRLLRPYKFWVTLALCCLIFLAGIPLTSSGGMYLLQLLDTYGVGYALLIIGIIEVLVVAWRYGAQNLLDNIQAMLNRRPSRVWYYVWKFVTPTVLAFAIIFQIWELKPIEYGEHRFPEYAGRIGWCLTSLPLLPIPMYALYKVCKERHRGETLQALLIRLTASHDFVPALGKYRSTVPNKSYKITIGDDDVFN